MVTRKGKIRSQLRGSRVTVFVLQTASSGIIEIDNPMRGIFICGGAGSGKSKSIIEPIIQQSDQASFTSLVYDFKFPILASGESLAGSRIKPWFVNFIDPSCSHQISLISPKSSLTPAMP